MSSASWITITAGTSGSGTGTVAYTVAANSGRQRSGTITIAGQTIGIKQRKRLTPGRRSRRLPIPVTARLRA